MKFVILVKASNFVVRRFSCDSQVKAEVVFGRFLKEFVKDDCFNNFCLMRLLKRV